MTRYALLLRAINVGGRKLPMADLRKLLTELGHTDVQTILASGQAVVTSDRDGDEIGDELEQRLVQEFGLKSEVMVRSGAELAKIVAGCPFAGADEAGNRFGVVFFRDRPTKAQLARLDEKDWGDDEWELKGRELYLSVPNGFGQSDLSIAVGKVKGVPATTRNWNTVQKLAVLTA